MVPAKIASRRDPAHMIDMYEKLPSVRPARNTPPLPAPSPPKGGGTEEPQHLSGTATGDIRSIR